MAKKFEDFYNSHVGKKYGTGQCVAGYNEYCSWLGIKRNSCYSASQLWTGSHDGCTAIKGRPSSPQNGDIIIYGSAGSSDGGNGHVGMYYNGRCFGQNQCNSNWTLGGPFNTCVSWTIMPILGVYRPKRKYLNNNGGIRNIKIKQGIIVSVTT